MDLSSASITLAASFLIAAYLIHKAVTPPNPTGPPAKVLVKDSLGRVLLSKFQRQISRFLFFFLWFCHILLILFPRSTPSTLYPHHSQLDPTYFTWSLYTASYILLILITAPTRVLAFKQLGQNFTFTLTKPKELVKTGMYAYIRHLSYPTLLACHIASCALFMRWGGAIGCWLPAWLAQWSSLDIGLFILLGVGTLYWLLIIRVREEEDILRSGFGEYKAYARRAEKILPWII